MRDEITFNILTALQIKLTEGETARTSRGHTTNLEAYLLFWNAVEEFQRFNKEGNAKARTLAKRVIELDPDWSQGWLILGWTYLQAIQYGADRTESIRLGSEYAEKAFQLDALNPDNNAILAFVAMASLAVSASCRMRTSSIRPSKEREPAPVGWLPTATANAGSVSTRPVSGVLPTSTPSKYKRIVAPS